MKPVLDTLNLPFSSKNQAFGRFCHQAREIVEHTPGYCTRTGDSVYSDRYGRRKLTKIRNKIRTGFYDLRQVLHVIRKAGRIGMMSWRDLAVAIPHTASNSRRKPTKLLRPTSIFGDFIHNIAAVGQQK